MPRLFLALSVAGLPCVPFILATDPSGRPFAPRLPCALFLAGSLVAALAWSLQRLFAAIRVFRAQERPGSETRRWASTLRAMGILGLVLAPLSIANDVFLLPRLLWDARLPNILPLLAVGIGLSHLIGSLKTNLELRRTAGESPSGPRGDPERAPSEARLPSWSGAGLTPRETGIARLLVSGYSYRGAAARLGIGAATVKTHVLKVYEKTGAGNKLELLLFADD